jgi:hypothetical protein
VPRPTTPPSHTQRPRKVLDYPLLSGNDRLERYEDDTLEGAPEERRAALQAVLGGERLQVLPDLERGFRVEGLVRVRLEAEPARKPGGVPGRSLGGSGGAICVRDPRPGALYGLARRGAGRGDRGVEAERP